MKKISLLLTTTKKIRLQLLIFCSSSLSPKNKQSINNIIDKYKILRHNIIATFAAINKSIFIIE